MPIELTLLLTAIAFSLLVGVPVIRLGIWLPRDLQFEIVPNERMTDAQRSHFARLDAALAPMAYFPRLSFSTNLQGATLTRVYLCDHDSAVLGAHCLRGANILDERHPSGHNYLEFITRYAQEAQGQVTEYLRRGRGQHRKRARHVGADQGEGGSSR